MPLGSIINMQAAPSFGAGLGAGFGQGLAQTSEKMVNQKLNELLQQKQLAMQHAEWYDQGEAIAKLRTKDPEQRKTIAATIGAVGPENWMKMEEMYGEQNLQGMLSETTKPSLGSGMASKTPQDQKYQNIPGITAPGMEMGAGGQGTMPQRRAPTIEQQEMLQATNNQAKNTQLMANNVAPNIQGLPKTGQAMPTTELEVQPEAQPEEDILKPTTLKYVTEPEEDFNKRIQGLPLKQQKEARAARAKQQALEIQKINATTKERALKGVEKERIVKRAEEKTKDLRENVSAIRQTLINRKNDLAQQREAVQRGNFGPLSLPHLATIFGLKESAGTDAKQLAAAVKNSVYDKLKTITGIKNVFLEQITMGAFPEIGSTKEGNLIAVDEAEMSIELDEALANSFDRVSEKYEDDPKYGYLPPKAIKEVYQGAEKEAKEIAKKYNIKIQEDRESQISDNALMNLERQPIKTPLTQRRSDAVVKKAENDLKRSFGKMPKQEQVLQYASQNSPTGGVLQN